MASVDLLGAIELHHGYRTCKQASDLLDTMFDRPIELQQLNNCADRSSRNEMKHHLAMLVRRDTRLFNNLTILSALS
jgi:hypothetical protein